MGRIIVGGIGFAAFFMPVFGGIRNIGTFTGLLFFGFLFIWGVFGKKLDPVIADFVSRRAGKTLACFLAAVMVFAALTVTAETFCILRSVFNTPPSGDVTLVVLGCKVNGTSPSLMLRERIDAASEFLKQNPEANCVLSGGQGEDEEISEAECMFNELVEDGISPERLFLEDMSTTTKENIEFSYNIIKEKNLNPTVAVVTNEFHEYRSGLIANELGLKCYSVPAKTAIWLLPTYFVREWYAIIYEVVFR